MRKSAVFLLLALAGCQTPNYDAADLCPIASQRTPEQDKALSDGLQPVKDNAAVTDMVLEWQRLRDESYACNAAQKKAEQ